MATVVASSPRSRPHSNTKIFLFALLGLVTLFVTYGKNREVLNPGSQMAQHYAPVVGILIVHGIAAGLAMVLAVFQFSNRLRARYLPMHRVLGYIYVSCVFLGAPLGIPIAARIDGISLTFGSAVQALGWMGCTAVALFCIRRGNVAEHRRWMIRGYPFAIVFTVARMIIPIPAIQRMGLEGTGAVVWTLVALAALLPSFFLEWGAITRRPAAKVARA